MRRPLSFVNLSSLHFVFHCRLLVSPIWDRQTTVPDPVCSTWIMAGPKTASTRLLMIKTSNMWFTAISHPSRVQPGP